MTIGFKLKNEKSIFAVECKWKEIPKGDWANFADPEQIKRYKSFQEKENIPVYVAIGLGGKPSSPEKLYIVPLSKIDTNNEASAKDICFKEC